MENILEVNNVSKAFPKSGFALDSISFALPGGAIMGFIGENGAGKTTTINCILNTMIKDSGTVKLFGAEMSDKDTLIREEIGVVYDGDNFPSYLNAAQLANILRGAYKKWDDALYQSYLERFRLSPAQKIKTYSKGMSMKLAISAALAHHPKLLVLDEATSGLDPVMRDEILDVFLDFVQKDDHSILLSSHITSDLEKIADYITLIHDGRIILSLLKDELIYRYGIMRCKEKQFLALQPDDIVTYRKRDFQTDVLVSDVEKIRRKYQDVVIDHASIDEIMLLLVKGERL